MRERDQALALEPGKVHNVLDMDWYFQESAAQVSEDAAEAAVDETQMPEAKDDPKLPELHPILLGATERQVVTNVDHRHAAEDVPVREAWEEIIVLEHLPD